MFLCAKAGQASRREKQAWRDILLLISRPVPSRSSPGMIGAPDCALVGEWKWQQVTEGTASLTMESLV
jgi:hypothetical protein